MADQKISQLTAATAPLAGTEIVPGVQGGNNVKITASDIKTYAQTGLGTAATLNAGVAGGVATLDGGGTVPTSQLPAAVLGAVKYQGTWNASTNTPTLASSTGTQGYYYVVSADGSTNLNGVTDWKIGDWAIYNGSAWQKIDNTDAVTSVAGKTGVVTLVAADVTDAVSTSGSYANPSWITSLAGSKISGNITGNAANVTGTVAIANGGTGGTTAAGARTNLGATTVGANVFTLANPSAITFPRFNADNSVSALDAATFRTAIGAGAGTVTSVSGTGSVNGLTLSGTVTSSGSLTLGGTLSNVSLTSQITGTLPIANGGTGLTTTPSNGRLLIGNGTGYTLANLTAGTGITITNGAGSITIASSAGASLIGTTNTGNPFFTALGQGAAGSGALYNTSIGYQANGGLTSGSSNTALGYKAGFANTTSNGNVYIGTESGVSCSSGAFNTAIGNQAMQNATTASSCVAIGRWALRACQSSNNVAVGNLAASSISTGEGVVAIGDGALSTHSSGQTGQTAIGMSAAALSNVYSITAVGYQCLYNSVAEQNTAVGHKALLSNTTGFANVAFGHEAGQSITTGGRNVVIGTGAMLSSTTAESCVVIGTSAARFNAIGSNNTIIGESAGNSLSGANNTIIGQSAGNYVTGNGNIIIGRTASPSVDSVNYEITLGDGNITTLRCNATTITSLSDARDKTDVAPLTAGVDFVNALNPVSFTWDSRDGSKVGVADAGFIAQELQAAQDETGINIPGLVYDTNPDRLEASYGKLIPVLVKAIQELSAKVAELEAKAN